MRRSSCGRWAATAMVIGSAWAPSAAVAGSDVASWTCSPFAGAPDAAGFARPVGHFGGSRDFVGSTRVATPRAKGGKRAPIVQQIDVYVHVLDLPGVVSDVPDERVRAQIDHLNTAFTGDAVFTLRAIDRSTDSAWYRMEAGSAEELAAKAALHRGDASDLNFYIRAPFGASWGTFPWRYRTEPTRDGIVVSRDRLTPLPGVSTIAVEGDVTVHEVGHWLGLYHTFQDACARRGDYVDDTPADASDVGDCNEGLDSCPDHPGNDPVHNYMDYQSDACVTHFTPGQRERADAMWKAYRA